MSFLNAAMLMGLVAVAIPPIIHLLNRRRYEIVDWGAMQFLQISEVTRRRILIEEVLLMAMRMGLIAILVLALAQPFTSSSILPTGGRPKRDIVLVVDGSASMSFKEGDQSTQEKAREWAREFVKGLERGDSVAVIVARKQPVLLIPKLTTDREKVRKQLELSPGEPGALPPPGGTADMARAVQAAQAILDKGQNGERDIIVIGDGQRHGWADARSLLSWEDLASKREGITENKPNLWCVNLDPQRSKDVPNWSLAPLTSGRAVVAAGQRLRFRTAIVLTGKARYDTPYAFKAELDGQAVELEDEKGGKFQLPDPKNWSGGQVALEFWVRAPAKVGSHLLSLVLEPDPPREKRAAGHVVKDHLPLDNQRDFALEVVQALPVLIVDGDEKPDATKRGSDFLLAALAPKKDPTPAVRVRVVRIDEFNAGQLRNQEPNGKEGDDRPRVVILCNVAKLSEPQQKALETFLNEGGGVLVTLGDRADADVYNKQYHREGKGWFPARLDKVLGEDNQAAKAARPLTESFYHPALEMFRKGVAGGLDAAWFAKWWRLSPPESEDRGSIVARLDKNETPLFIEGRRGEGRIMVCAVPLDNSWRTSLFNDLPGFVPLSHELVYYLADARASEHNLEPGQPLRYRLPRDVSPTGLTLRSPADTEAKAVVIGDEENEKTYNARLVEQANGALLIHEGLFETGVWKLANRDGETVHYVVQPDAREADLAPIDDTDREKVNKHVAFRYQDDGEQLLTSLSRENRRQEFWWWFLMGVILLLCGEVWMTRRIVKNRA